MISERRRVTAWARVGRLLALVAALTVMVGLHPPHATAAGASANHGHAAEHVRASDHSHFSAACVKAAVEEPLHSGAGPAAQSDCHQLFHPLLRALPPETPAFSTILAPSPRAERARQLNVAADPPPPRTGT